MLDRGKLNDSQLSDILIKDMYIVDRDTDIDSRKREDASVQVPSLSLTDAYNLKLSVALVVESTSNFASWSR